MYSINKKNIHVVKKELSRKVSMKCETAFWFGMMSFFQIKTEIMWYYNPSMQTIWSDNNNNNTITMK